MIERIIIENFKSIRKLDLELKPINILIGANGAGKSNFLLFFYITKRVMEFEHTELSLNIDKILFFGRKRSSMMKGEIQFDTSHSESFTIVPIEGSPFSYIDKKQLHIKTETNDNNHLVDKELKSIKSESQHLRIYHFQDTGGSSPLKQINKLDDNEFLRESGANLAAFLFYLKEKHFKEFKNIENQIRSVAPFFDHFNLSPRKLDEEEIRLRWFEKGVDTYFDAYDLSDGTLRFMALTTLLLQPDLPKTIIIDEPELGLHPFAINKLAAMMKQAAVKGSQVIVSTQSTDLVNNFEPEDVIAVDREDNQSVFRRLNSEDLEEWLEDYTLGDLWNKNVIGARP